MNIDRIMARSIYKTNMNKISETDLKKQPVAQLETKEKAMDTVIISADAAKRKVMDKAVKLVKKDFEYDSSSEKIERLKGLITEGKYYVSDEDIADSILGKL